MVVAALVVAAVAVCVAAVATWYSIYTRRQMDLLRQQVAEALDAEQIMRRARKPGRGRFIVIAGGAAAAVKEHKTATAALAAVAGLAAILFAWPDPERESMAQRDPEHVIEAPPEELEAAPSTTTTTEPDASEFEPIAVLDDNAQRASVGTGSGGRSQQVPPLTGVTPADTHGSAGTPSPSTTSPPVVDQPPPTSPPVTTAPPEEPPPPTTSTTVPPPDVQPERDCRLILLDLLQLVSVCL